MQKYPRITLKFKTIILSIIVCLLLVESTWNEPKRIINQNLPKIYSSQCHISKDNKEWSASNCTFGKIDSHNILFLTGDSHAAQWFPLFFKYAFTKKYKLIVLTRSSCPPLLNVIRIVSPEDKSCNDFINIMKEEINNLPTGSFVVFSSLSIIHSYNLGGESNKYMQTFTKGISNLKISLKNDLKYYWIEDSPKVPFKIESCNNAYLISGSICKFTRSYSDEEKILRDSLIAMGIETLDTRKNMCPKNVCSTIQHGINVWRNQSHLSVEYVEKFDAKRWKIWSELN